MDRTAPLLANAQPVGVPEQQTEQPSVAPLLAEAGGTGEPAPRSHISRHRRVHKEVGAVTGITFMDHPKGNGVVVSELKPDGACFKSGVRVGDHVSKINGERPNNRDHAVSLCDSAWLAEADGTDKNKDRLKFSLHLRTQDFSVGRQTSGLSAGAIVGVESLNGGGARKSLLGGGKKLEESGLALQDSPAGFGALIVGVVPDSAAHVAGLEPGQTIVSIDGVLCSGAAPTAKRIDAERSKKGVAALVCHLKKEQGEHI